MAYMGKQEEKISGRLLEGVTEIEFAAHPMFSGILVDTAGNKIDML